MCELGHWTDTVAPMRGRIAIGLLVVAFAAGCGDSDEPSDSSTTTPAAAPLMCPDPATHAAAPFDANELVGKTVKEAEVSREPARLHRPHH